MFVFCCAVAAFVAIVGVWQKGFLWPFVFAAVVCTGLWIIVELRGA